MRCHRTAARCGGRVAYSPRTRHASSPTPRYATDGVLDADLLETLVRRRELGEPPEHIVGYGSSPGPAVGRAGVFIPRQRSVFAPSTLTRVRDAGEQPVVVEAYCGVAPIASVIAAGSMRGRRSRSSSITVRRRPHARRNLPAAVRVERAALPGEMDGPAPRGCPRIGGRDGGRRALRTRHAAGSTAAEATDHEPADSHDGGPDGLDAVRGADRRRPALVPVRGVMLLECHRDQATAALPHAADRGLDCRVRPVTTVRPQFLRSGVPR